MPMLSERLENNILNKLGEVPTEGQRKLIKLISDFILNNNDNEIFLLTGYAGTGKTLVISAVINALADFKIKTILMAPTGRAAKVLSSFSENQAFTIHKKIYKQQSSKDGMGKFVLGKNLNSGTFYLVDEASLIGNQQTGQSIFGSGNLLEDLLGFVYSGRRCKLILIGDPAQLPPVGISERTVLTEDNLRGSGFAVISFCLTEVVRQAIKSGILYNATVIRELINKVKVETPKLKVENFPDIKNVSGNDLLNELNEAYEKFGIEETIVITRSNKRANLYNKGIRQSILFYDEKIVNNDYLMVVKNNYYWLSDEDVNFIANGDIIQIIKLWNFEERYGFHFVDARLRLIDLDNREIEAKILLETLDIDSASLSQDENKKFFYTVYEDYKHLKPKRSGFVAVRKNPYFNALQVKFSYAVTCHKAQGGQWKAVFIDQGYFNPETLNSEYLKWLYTAFTRAAKKLYLINFNKVFFES